MEENKKVEKKEYGKNALLVLLIFILVGVIGICANYVIKSFFKVQEDGDKTGSSESVPMEDNDIEEDSLEEEDGKILYDNIISKIASVNISTLLRKQEFDENLKRSLVITYMETNNAFSSSSKENISQNLFSENYKKIFGENNYTDIDFNNVNACNCPVSYIFDESTKMYTGDMTVCGCGTILNESAYEKTEITNDQIIVYVRVSYHATASKDSELYIQKTDGTVVQVDENNKEDWMLQKYTFEKEENGYVLKTIVVD